MSPLNRMVVCASHAPGMARDVDRHYGLEFRRGLQTARQRIQDFAPELVVIFGVDHIRAFDTVVPSVAVVSGAAGRGDAGSPTGEYRVDAEVARGLAEGLLARDVDCGLVRHALLDHGFGQIVGDLVGALDAVPVVPVYLNCADPPLMPFSRAVTIGAAVGEVLAGQARRVLYLASGGLSHEPPALVSDPRGLSEEERLARNLGGAEAALAKLNPEWDRAFLSAVASEPRHRHDFVRELDNGVEEAAGCGANEVRTWLAAWAAGQVGLTTIAYEPVPKWITGMGVVAGVR